MSSSNQVAPENGSSIPLNEQESTNEVKSPPYLPWPPPGLERIHGAFLPIVRSLGLGGAIVVLPLLWAVAIEQNFWKLGPMGEHWWALTLTSCIGLFFILFSIYRFVHIIHEGRMAILQGHRWLTVVQVGADYHKDTGFLIRGGRLYAVLEAEERNSLLLVRLIGTVLYWFAVSWISFGFIFSVFLAARGVFSPGAVVWVTVLPVILLFGGSIFCRLKEYFVISKARKTAAAAVQTEISSQVAEWISNYDSMKREGVLSRGMAGHDRMFRAVAIVCALAGLIFFVSISGFIYVNSIIPSQMAASNPMFQGLQMKVDRVGIYKRFRLSPNPMTSPQQAGKAFHNLDCTGRTRLDNQFIQTPATQYEQEWTFGRNLPEGMPPAITLLEMRSLQLTSEYREALRNEAMNPAHQEFEIVGRAMSADIFGARWVTPFPESRSWTNMPVVRLRFADAARSHVAKAAYELHQGQTVQAEQTIKEIISAGFLLIDEDINLVGNLVGVVVVEIGGTALRSFYNATGREEVAQEMTRSQAELEQSLRLSLPEYSGEDIESDLRIIATTVLDNSKVRGLRWELLAEITTVTPCINLHKVVFGPGDDYLQWLEQAESSLVRRPSEQEIFNLLKRGKFATLQPGERRGFMGFLLGLMFGNSEATGGCVEFYSTSTR